LSAREAAAVGIDIARALSAVHAAGLLHCDVKAQNVVRESGGRVVLMDFGAGRLAPEMRDEDQIFDVAGTPRYMAPELFAPGASATRQSDIYSLGVLVYFLVSGRYPVEGRTFSELRRAHEAGVSRSLRELNPALPVALTDAVAGAIERDPAKRFDSAAEVQDMLVSAVTAPDVTPPARPVRWPIVVSLLSLLTLVSAMWLTRPQPAAVFAPNSIAVMPIRNLTGDPSMQLLADAATEALVGQLVRIPGLDVASPARLAAVRGSSEFEREIAAALRVRFLLVGSIVHSDGRVRINVMLNDPRAGRTVAATEVERTPATLLSARSEVARWVAERLGLAVPPNLE
jgi:serine/threonine protein kinase